LIEMQVQMGNPGHALDDAKALLKVAQKIEERAPDDPENLRRVFVGHEQNADLNLGTGGVAGAIEHYLAAVNVARRMVELEPGSDVAQAHLWTGLTGLSRSKLKDGNAKDSLAYQLMARDVTLANLKTGKGEGQWLHNARYTFTKLGDLYRGEADLGAELEACSRAVEFSRRVEQMGDASNQWSYSHWYALSQWGGTLAKHRKFQDALAAQAEAKDYAERFLMSKEKGDETALALWFSLRETGETFVAMGDVNQGQAQYRLALQLADRQVHDHPASAIWQSYHQTSLVELEALRKL
jgi:tetratricopeptide (TPR) repeat protein